MYMYMYIGLFLPPLPPSVCVCCVCMCCVCVCCVCVCCVCVLHVCVACVCCVCVCVHVCACVCTCMYDQETELDKLDAVLQGFTDENDSPRAQETE